MTACSFHMPAEALHPAAALAVRIIDLVADNDGVELALDQVTGCRMLDMPQVREGDVRLAGETLESYQIFDFAFNGTR